MKGLAAAAAILVTLSAGAGQEPKAGDDKKTQPDRPRSGVVRDAKGNEKAFEFIRGVPAAAGADLVDEKQAVFFAGGDWYYVPLKTLAAIEVGKDDVPKSKVVLRATDGKQQTIEVDLNSAVEVKWKGDIAILRTRWATFQNSTFTFDK